MVIKAAKFLKQNLSYLIILMMVLGLISGYKGNTQYLKGLITPTLFLMIYPMMINLKMTDVFKEFKAPKTLLVSLGINFLISPVLAFILGRLFFSNYPELFLGLLLIALIPTSGMTASWTGLAGGNMKTALLIISTSLLLAIPVIPLYLKLLAGKVVLVDTLMMAKSLLKVVVIPLVLGDITRRFLLKGYGEDGFKRLQPVFGGLSALGVLFIVFIALSLKSKTLLGDTGLVLTAAIPLLLYYGAMFLSSHRISGRMVEREDGVALVYGSAMRNLTLALGLAISNFGGLSVFLIAFAYVFQVPLAAFFMQYLKRVAIAG